MHGKRRLIWLAGLGLAGLLGCQPASTPPTPLDGRRSVRLSRPATVSKEEFDVDSGPFAAGKKVFVANNCFRCHAINGVRGRTAGGPGVLVAWRRGRPASRLGRSTSRRRRPRRRPCARPWQSGRRRRTLGRLAHGLHSQSEIEKSQREDASLRGQNQGRRSTRHGGVSGKSEVNRWNDALISGTPSRGCRPLVKGTTHEVLRTSPLDDGGSGRRAVGRGGDGSGPE